MSGRRYGIRSEPKQEALNMTRAQKINGAKIEVASANDGVTRYMKSNFREDSVRTFLLARVDRAHARLRQAESTP